MEKRVANAIEVFLRAIDSGTLAKGSCTACAVGNLVAHGMGGVISKDLNCNKPNSFWSFLFTTNSGGQHIYRQSLNDTTVMQNIESTEFTWEELAKIEYAFETNTKIDYVYYDEHTSSEILDDQIKGLEAVIEVMLSFSNDKKTNVKKVFTERVGAL